MPYPLSVPLPAFIALGILRAILLAAPAVFLFSPVHAGALTGRIVDGGGKPLAGVSLSLEKSKASGISDGQGRFTLATVGLTKAGGGKSPGPATPTHGTGKAALSFTKGREEILFGEGKTDASGRRLVSAQDFEEAPTALRSDREPLRKTAAWDDTLALSKSAFLAQRIVPRTGDGDLGDLILYAVPTGTQDKYLGFDQYRFTVAGKSCLIVAPKKTAVGNPWIWRTYFWDHKHHFDSLMCARGYYLAFMDAPNLYGAPQAVSLMDSFYVHLTAKAGFSRKTNLVGISRGAFYAYNWGRANIGKISTLYGDGAGMDYVSWPCGCYGTGTGSSGDWASLKSVFGFANDVVAKAYPGNPYQNMKPFAQAKIPIIHVYGETDRVAPPQENVLRGNDSLKVYGWQMRLLAKPNTGHTHGVDASDGGTPGQLDTLVDFVIRNTSF